MKKVKLKDICKFYNGRAFKQHELLDSGKYVVLRVGNFFNDKAFYYSDLELDDTKYCSYGDLLFAWSASFGPKIWQGEKTIFHYHIWRIDVNQNKVLKKYLYYYLFFMSEKIKHESHGGVMLHTTKKEMEERELILPSLQFQKKLIDKLDKITNIISSRNVQLIQLDNLIKSRFVEMFGNPMDWSIANTLFTKTVIFNPKKSEIVKNNDLEVSFVPMECIGIDGSFKIQRNGKIDEFYKGYTYFRDNDVLIAKITPCFENGKSAIAKGCKNGVGFGTTEFHVARPIEGISTSEWIQFLFKNKELHNYASKKMAGAAGQKRIQKSFFEKLPVYLPSIEEQNQFAAFVEQVNKSKFILLLSIQMIIKIEHVILNSVGIHIFD